MSDEIPPGKLPVALLRELLASLPPLPPEVRLGPRVGEDACAIDLPAGTLGIARICDRINKAWGDLEEAVQKS